MKPADAPAPSRLNSRTALLLTLIVFLPVLTTFLYVRAFSVEVPIWDDWDMLIPHIGNIVSGHLHWSDFNVQHNEAVLLFPQMASLLLASVTHMQFVDGIYLSYAFQCGSLVLLFLFFRLIPLPGRWSILWFLPVSLLFLGWRQSDSILWSTQIVNTMPIFFSLATLYCCTQIRRGPAFLAAGIVLGWLASFSMASGLLVWPFGAICILALWDAESRGATFRRLAWWLSFGAACGIVYFLDRGSQLDTVTWPTGFGFLRSHLPMAARYSLVYFAGSLGRSPGSATRLGEILFLIAVPTLLLAIRKVRTIPGVLPSLLIVGYTFAALSPLLLRRLGLGVEQAFSSRYVALNTLVPVGIYFCLLALMRHSAAARWLLLAMTVVLAVGIFNSYSLGLTLGRKDWTKKLGCAQALKEFHQRPPEDFLCLYPYPAVVSERAVWLEKNRLSLFHN